jgi:hypothetical protein
MGPNRDLGAGSETDLVADVLDVGIDGSLGNPEFCSSFAVSESGREEPRHLGLTRAER